jgi:hemoglobin
MKTVKYSDNELIRWVTLVTTEFYELVYKDDWLGEVFQSVPKEFITSQQIAFMVGLLGGPKNYSGRNAKDAHPHIFVTEEMWLVRESFLVASFEKLQFPDDLAQLWLKIDEAFKSSIVMNDPSECRKRFTTDELIIVPSPYRKSS